MGDSKETVFQIQQDWCTYELTETVTAHTGPTKVQARWGLKIERGEKDMSLTLNRDVICN